jgi:hypothetical protein
MIVPTLRNEAPHSSSSESEREFSKHSLNHASTSEFSQAVALPHILKDLGNLASVINL